MIFRRDDDPACRDGCKAAEENPPEFVKDACEGCPWAEETEPIIDLLIRRWRRLKLGISIAERDLSPWEADAILAVDDAIRAEQEKQSIRKDLKGV